MAVVQSTDYSLDAHRVYQCHWPLFFPFFFLLVYSLFCYLLHVRRRFLETVLFCGWFSYKLNISVRARVLKREFSTSNSVIGQRPKFVMKKKKTKYRQSWYIKPYVTESEMPEKQKVELNREFIWKTKIRKTVKIIVSGWPRPLSPFKHLYT